MRPASVHFWQVGCRIKQTENGLTEAGELAENACFEKPDLTWDFYKSKGQKNQPFGVGGEASVVRRSRRPPLLGLSKRITDPLG